MADKANNWNQGENARQSPHGLASARKDFPRWRARPDGCQHWVRLPVDPASAVQLRVRAIEGGLTVDAWFGIAIAYATVKLEAEEPDLYAALREALASVPLAFAPNERLRSWQSYLLAADGPGLGDELPEVVVGAGISLRDVAEALPTVLEMSDAELDLARECELRAAAESTPLPTYITGLVETRV